jgi:predicted nucleic acid-binding protein
MFLVKDSMVVIHLAKMMLLEDSCNYFKNVIIPKKVYEEIMVAKKHNYPEISIIEEMMVKNRIKVKKVKNKKYLARVAQFNIQRGEAEAVALYWQEKADYLATDDDNVRKKKVLLNVNLLGTLVIVLKLYKKKMISEDKFKESLEELRKIGWFSNAVIDKVLLEGING